MNLQISKAKSLPPIYPSESTPKASVSFSGDRMWMKLQRIHQISCAWFWKICQGLTGIYDIMCLGKESSHVSLEQCRLLATHLQNHPTLECLDLSHNAIGYRGICALSKLLTVKCQIKSLNLTNNRLKSTSGLALAYTLSQSDCLLVQLNLRMNKLHDGGIALVKLSFI
ncbi:hypothetical protein Smp_060560 [Schistosoma mansoni]|uniref:Si:dkey-288a3.2 n=1 Tax=Schistosoma mansoni TaxID=6183 RepID=G4V6I3_SCHMA|nr:hypothetical protein Smp_060560 [Schistosoma mansoni]|eukprot:XP_018648665.1 hypothetical protein Smp_060560 [Schistosoma mansoni]